MNSNSIFELYRHLQDDSPSRQLAIIGGGGKSSMLVNIAGRFRLKNCKALFTTTTKMQPAEIGSAVGHNSCYLVNDYQELLEAIDGQGNRPLFCHCGIRGDKVFGVEARWLAKLATERPNLPVIYEADGSRGLPLKLHAVDEPMLAQPSSVMFLIGLCALGSNTRDTLHRFPKSGQRGCYVDADYLVNLATMALDKLVILGSKMIFLNQYELLSSHEIQAMYTAKWNYPVFLGSVQRDYYIQIH